LENLIECIPDATTAVAKKRLEELASGAEVVADACISHAGHAGNGANPHGGERGAVGKR